MSEEDTVKTLVLAGIILQIFFVINGFLGVLFFPLMLEITIAVLPTPPTTEVLAFLTIFIHFLIGLYMVHGILGIIYIFLWFHWRRDPSAHRTGLLVTGALGLVFGGLIPGLIVLIASRMIPREVKT
ncbi:MAG: hypothetical protein ACFFCF_03275 [Promethearchaeota archaeon]